MFDGIAFGTELIDFRAGGEDSVNGGFDAAGDVGGDVGNGHQVLVIDVRALASFADGRKGGEGYGWPGGAGDGDAADAVERSAVGAGEAEGDGQGFQLGFLVEETGGKAGGGEAKGLGDGEGRNAV